MDDATGLAAEQSVVTLLYARLDELRAEALRRLADVRREGPSGSPQNRSERDAFAANYSDRIATLDAVEDRLCFGRLDLTTGDRRYIGRIGISTSEQVPILTDWRAPAAAPFYAATSADPKGVSRRRHLTTVGRRVTAIEDDALDLTLDGEPDGELVGGGALMAALAARRTGRMSDIVATIQTEQDAVIRAPLAGALVVQGGPGTGKTAVALHRAAFLLYEHRARLESSGILIIGPSRRFLQYIDHVLPSLGETGAVSTTLAGLVRGVSTTAREHDSVARVKGKAAMARVIANAVRERQRLPLGDQDVTIDGRTITIRRDDIAAAQAHARRDGAPHNTARTTFAKDMVRRLATQLAEQMSGAFGDLEAKDLERDIRESRDVRIALNLAWLPLTAEHLLRDLFSRPHLLDHAAPRLTRTDRDLLFRRPDAPFTDADIPLLDEAAHLLGDLPGGDRSVRGPSADELEYARGVLEIFGSDIVTADMLAHRMAPSRERLTVGERAARDPEWTFGHVIVDEAQELSEMAWRMLLRRCPARSFTILGDLAQAATPHSAQSWHDALASSFGDAWSERTLTVSYRIPASVAHTAQRYALAAGLPVSDLTAVRDVEGAVRVTRALNPVGEAGRLARAHAERLASTGGGLCAIIAPERMVHAALSEVVDLAEVAVLAPRDAKGLEFDVVIVVDPGAIAESPGDLYVALTRATSALEIVAGSVLPPGLDDAELANEPRAST